MARRAQYALVAQVTADGNYTFAGGGTSRDLGWQGGYGTLMVTNGGGTFGTHKLQIQAPNGTWLDTGAQLTAVGLVGFLAPAGPLRLNVAGSVGATIDAWVVGIPANVGG